MKNGKTQWFDKFKRLYYKLTIKGYCSYHQKYIINIKDCGVCSVCNWAYKCNHLIDFKDLSYIHLNR